MAWFVEKPLFIVMMGSLTAVILGGFWMQTGRKSVLYAMFASIGITAALLLLERSVVTDREQIDATLHAIARAVERNDIETALLFAHSQADWLRRQARGELPRYDFRSITIKPNLAVEVDADKSPPQAVARFNVVVVLNDREGVFRDSRVPRFVTVKFEKEGPDWRVIDYEHEGPYEGYKQGASTDF